MSKFTDAGRTYLVDMTRDKYYPPHLVAKVRAELEGLVSYLDEAPRSTEEVQARCNVMTENINGLVDAFYEADSEIETVARDDIAKTVISIFEVYGISLDIEEALGGRDW